MFLKNLEAVVQRRPFLSEPVIKDVFSMEAICERPFLRRPFLREAFSEIPRFIYCV